MINIDGLVVTTEDIMYLAWEEQYPHIIVMFSSNTHSLMHLHGAVASHDKLYKRIVQKFTENKEIIKLALKIMQ